MTETLQTPVQELTTGSTFAGRYHVIEELGHGGMGRVYKVHDTKIGEKVALKLIRPEAGPDRKTLERFSNELKLARKIRHKNVCQMFDLGEDRGTRYITMEYVHGEDLRQLIRKVGRLSPGQAISIARQVCAGLEEAHKLGVVHRDLKPQNIMLDEDGSARIMDFGIARSLAGKSITGAGVLIGTPEYMSPEQVEGKDVDPRSDIYSLGIILYEMVAGRRPFDGETALAIAHKQKHETPEDPRKIDPRIPDDLSRMILKCLEKDKAARYESARTLDADLAAIEEGLPTTEKALPKRKGLTTKDITVTFNLRRLIVPALAALVLIGAAFILWKAMGGKKPAAVVSSTSGKPSIAVMYFENQTEKPGLDKMAVTLLTTNLSRYKNIGVTSAQRLFDILKLLGKEDAESIDRSLATEVATRAGVKTMLLGSIVQIGSRIRLASELIDVKTGSIIGTQSEDGTKFDDLFSMVDGITEQVGKQFGGNNTEGSLKVADVTTSSLEALDYYQKAFDLGQRFNFPAAAILLKKAVAIDPEFAMAYGTLALVQTGSPGAEYDLSADFTEAKRTLGSAKKYWDRATEAERLTIQILEAALGRDLQKAASFGRELLARDSSNKWAYYNIAIDQMYRTDFQAAIRTLEGLLEQDPSDGLAYYLSASSLAYSGDFPAAISTINKYIAVQPDTSYPYSYAWELSMLGGLYDEAVGYADEAMKVNPAWTEFEALAGRALIHKGRGEEARERFRRLAQGVPAWPELAVFLRGLSYLREGRHREAEADFREAVDRLQKTDRPLEELRCRLGLGEALAIRGEFAEAHVQFAEAEKVSGRYYRYAFNPTPLWRRLFAGMAFVRQRQLDKAAAAVKEMTAIIAERKMEPVYFSYTFLLEAEIALARNNPKEALRLLRRISGLVSKSSPFGWRTLAAALEAMGNYKEAAEYYKSFLGWLEAWRNIDGESVLNYYESSMVDYNLGRIAEKTGDPAAAMAHFRKFLEGMAAADPGIPEVDDARKRLAGLTAR